MADWILIIAGAVIVWIIIFIDVIWEMLFRNQDQQTLRVQTVPEGRAVYWSGFLIIGQVSQILGPTRVRLNPRTNRYEKYFGFVVQTQDGQSNEEWVWSNEVDEANMEVFAGRPGMTFVRVPDDPTDEVIRDKEAAIFALKHELAQMYEITENRNKMIFDAVHEAVQKFLPKVAYMPKKKAGGGMPGEGGAESGE